MHCVTVQAELNVYKTADNNSEIPVAVGSLVKLKAAEINTKES